MRSLILITCFSIVSSVLACGDDDNAVADSETVDMPDDGFAVEVDTAPDSSADAAPDTDEEVIYPGHPCGGDQQCSTGLCYGLATPQGAFETPRCQTFCLGLSDFARYCDSDDDCCSGSCCVGCGAREGLCVLDNK